MAKVYITEYSVFGRDGKGMALGFPKEPAIVEQTPVAIGGGSVQSAAFGTDTKFIRIHADAVCSVKFGANPTADANSQRLAANWPEYYAVEPGHKVAVITNT